MNDRYENLQHSQAQPTANSIGPSREYVLNELFTYHPPSLDQLPKYEAIRDAAKYFAAILLKNTPPSADQSAAIRLLREAVMTANASIANNGMSL